MKHLPLLAASLLMANPVFAHGGAHLHPHGMELATAALACATVVLLIVAVRRK